MPEATVWYDISDAAAPVVQTPAPTYADKNEDAISTTSETHFIDNRIVDISNQPANQPTKLHVGDSAVSQDGASVVANPSSIGDGARASTIHKAQALSVSGSVSETGDATLSGDEVSALTDSSSSRADDSVSSGDGASVLVSPHSGD